VYGKKLKRSNRKVAALVSLPTQISIETNKSQSSKKLHMDTPATRRSLLTPLWPSPSFYMTLVYEFGATGYCRAAAFKQRTHSHGLTGPFCPLNLVATRAQLDTNTMSR
jgi:hypothetical protein